MSGFEIAGVVLGVLPLVISGLDQYKEGLDGISAALRYREVIADLITTFRAITAGYQTTCERVLRQLMLTEEEYSELFDDPQGAKWKSQDFNVSMRQCLGINYISFLEVVARLHRNILRFADKLDLDAKNMTPKWLLDDGKMTFRKRLANKSNRLFKSIQIGIDSGRLGTSLDKIESDLQRLERMIPDSTSASTVTGKLSARTRAIWKDVRESASHLFGAMAVSWACADQHDHKASLRLEPRDPLSSQQVRPRFSIVLSVQDTAFTSLQPTCYHLEVESTEDNNNSSNTGIASQSKVLPAGKAKQKSVTISEITKIFPKSSITVTQTLSSHPVSSTPKQRIQNLCHSLQLPGKVDGCLGFLEDQSWNHQVYRTAQFGVQSSWFTLQDVLSNRQVVNLGMTSQGGVKRQLSLPEKYRISHTLASSVLQLADTPWLLNGWALRNVAFTSAIPAAQINFPYIQNDFNTLTATQSTASSSPNRLISNEMTFALGVVLIELFYGNPLEELRRGEDLVDGKPTSMTDQLTATRLLDDIRAQHGDNFADAVERCIFGNFNSAKSTFENPGLQGQFYEGVIAPLKKISDAL